MTRTREREEGEERIHDELGGLFEHDSQFVAFDEQIGGELRLLGAIVIVIESCSRGLATVN